MNPGRNRYLFKILFYSILYTHPLIFLNLYLYGNWYSFFHDYTLGMVFGITAYCYICAAIILSSRIKYFDRKLGQDRILVIHGILASIGILLGIIHFLFKYSYISITLQTASGAAALGLFVLIMFLTFLFMRDPVFFPGFMRIKRALRKHLNVDYSVMKFIHNFFSFSLALTVLHVVLAYSSRENIYRLLFTGFYGITALFFYLYFIIFKRIILKKIFKVSSVEELSSSVVRLKLIPSSGDFRFRPGQFIYLRFKSPNIKREEHPFSFSSSPLETEVSVTVKRLGDYTMSLGLLEQGASSAVDGPYGIFTPQPDNNQKLFIAGGIGITPFLSILKDWEIRGYSFSATLLWSVRFERDLIDLSVIKRIEESFPGFSVKIFITGEQSSSYKKGRILLNDIRSAVFEGALDNTEVYICGPSLFMQSAEKNVLEAGVTKKNIFKEDFSF